MLLTFREKNKRMRALKSGTAFVTAVIITVLIIIAINKIIDYISLMKRHNCSVKQRQMHFKHVCLEKCSPLCSCYCWTLPVVAGQALRFYACNINQYFLFSILAFAVLKVDCTSLKNSTLKVRLCVCTYSCIYRGDGENLWDPGCHGISPSLAWKWGRGGRPWWDARRSHYGRKLPHWSGTGQAVMEGGMGTAFWRGCWWLGSDWHCRSRSDTNPPLPVLFCMPAGPPLL